MCARISDVEIQYSQLKINHLNDMLSTKAAGGGIYSGVLLKDIKVPVKVRRTLSSLVPLLPTGIASNSSGGRFHQTRGSKACILKGFS